MNPKVDGGLCDVSECSAQQRDDSGCDGDSRRGPVYVQDQGGNGNPTLTEHFCWACKSAQRNKVLKINITWSLFKYGSQKMKLIRVVFHCTSKTCIHSQP